MHVGRFLQRGAGHGHRSAIPQRKIPGMIESWRSAGASLRGSAVLLAKGCAVNAHVRRGGERRKDRVAAAKIDVGVIFHYMLDTRSAAHYLSSIGTPLAVAVRILAHPGCRRQRTTSHDAPFAALVTDRDPGRR